MSRTHILVVVMVQHSARDSSSLASLSLPGVTDHRSLSLSKSLFLVQPFSSALKEDVFDSSLGKLATDEWGCAEVGWYNALPELSLKPERVWTEKVTASAICMQGLRITALLDCGMQIPSARLRFESGWGCDRWSSGGNWYCHPLAHSLPGCKAAGAPPACNHH